MNVYFTFSWYLIKGSINIFLLGNKETGKAHFEDRRCIFRAPKASVVRYRDGVGAGWRNGSAIKST